MQNTQTKMISKNFFLQLIQVTFILYKNNLHDDYSYQSTRNSFELGWTFCLANRQSFDRHFFNSRRTFHCKICIEYQSFRWTFWSPWFILSGEVKPLHWTFFKIRRTCPANFAYSDSYNVKADSQLTSQVETSVGNGYSVIAFSMGMGNRIYYPGTHLSWKDALFNTRVPGYPQVIDRPVSG